MKVNPNQKLPANVPAWAKERVESLLKDGEKLTASSPTPDGFVRRDLTEETAVLQHWNNRTSLSRMMHLDNNEKVGRDADPKPGEVDVGWSRFSYQGNYSNGHLLQVTTDRDDQAVNLTLHQGKLITNVDIRQSGVAFYNRFDAEHPEESVSFETQASKDARTTDRLSEHFQATGKAADLIPKSKGESLEERAAASMYTGGEQLPELRQEIMGKLKSDIGQLPAEQQAKLKGLMDKPNARTPQQLHQAVLEMSRSNPEQKEIQTLKSLSGAWQAMEDAPKIMADGILRNQEFYMAPGTLQMQTAARGWEFDKKTGLPIADTVVVGAGPGGLATGYHLSQQGQRTVIFEGGKLGQGFSDASAQSVHQLRTTSFSSDLIYTNSRTDLGIDVSLRRHSESIRQKGEEAKESWNAMRGEEDHSSNEGFGALNRNNLFEHMAQLGHGLATKYPDTFLLENSPISSITKEKRGKDTLFRVKSDKGHEMLTRSLFMATGFVGSNGEYARGLQQFADLEKAKPEAMTVLGSDHDLVGKNDQLLDRDQALVFSDRLIGRPEIRARIKSLPAGSTLAVVGSGESAAKGTIEALHLNPELKVDLYTKNPLEPYQVQIPVSHFSNIVSENAIKDRGLADQTLKEFEQLKTPITTETMKDLLTFESEGRLRIREMGKRFNDETVKVELLEGDRPSFKLTLQDEEVSKTLQEQRESWTSAGLYGANPPTEAPDSFPDADMVMMAIGYDTSRVNASPLMQQLIDQDMVEIKDGRVQYGEDGLTSSLNPQVGFNTASAVRMSSDTALPGRAVRGLRLAQNLAGKLPTREAPSKEESIASGLPLGVADTTNPEEFPTQDLEWAKSLLSLKTNGTRPDTLEWLQENADAPKDAEDRAWNNRHRELGIKFAGPNSTVRALVGRYQEYPDTLTPAEKLTAIRALQISDRLVSIEEA